jgi:hypothetical protein
VTLGLRLRLDRRIGLHHPPLPGHLGAYRGRWYGHGHVDAYRLYRGDVGPALRISCSLKSIARLVGLAAIEVDRTRMQDLSREALHAYAASDARLARVLTERRWSTASRFVDRVDKGDHTGGRPRIDPGDDLVLPPGPGTEGDRDPAALSSPSARRLTVVLERPAVA